MNDPTTPEQARAYIALFRKYTLPGVTYVDTGTRKIQLDQMSDDDAVFVAREFQRMEAEAGRNATRQ
jgi:hypothetical protein